MNMKQIAAALDIEQYPENFDVILAQLGENPSPVCDLALIDEAQEKYGAFGDYYELVREGVSQVIADPVNNTWAKVSNIYLSDRKWGICKDIPTPPLDGTPKRDMTMIASMIPFIPQAAARYESAGFSHEEVCGYLRAYAHCLNSTRIREGYLGLNKPYFNWLYHFATASIFRVHGIQFEFTKLNKNGGYLKNKKTGAVMPVMFAGVVHASGEMLAGAGGYEDDTGAFAPEFTETEDSYICHAVIDQVVDREKKAYPKTEWELIAKPGDKCLGMHLPRGADIREENVRKACKAAFSIIEKSYPEYIGAPVQCSSWLLDPGIETLLGPDSNVVRFGKLFARYPGKSPGRAADGFVFPGKPVPVEELPEDTRLQRALKQHYRDGGYTYGYNGLLVL